jgi:hypothetical protein
LWYTIGQAYGVWGRNFAELIRIAWPWMAVIALPLAVIVWLQSTDVGAAMRAARAGLRVAEPNPFLSFILQIVGQLIVLPALAAVAVAWHRLLLRGEHPGAELYLRRDQLVIGYAILLFWLGLISMAPNYLGRLFQAMTGPVSALQTIVGLLALVALFIVARLSLALPALAVGRAEIGFGIAWAASTGNSWRMFLGYLFCILPWVVVVVAVEFLFLTGGRGVASLALLVIGLLWIPVGMISVGFLSLAYRHFFESR